MAPPAFLLYGAASSPAGGAGEHPVLEAQVQIAHALEHTAQLERPGDGFLAAEKIAHLHGISENPGSENGHSEAIAGTGTVVGQNLGERENSLDSETNSTQEADVGRGIGDGSKVEDGQDGDKVGEEEPVPVVAESVSAFDHVVKGGKWTHGLVFFHCQKS